jgi:hypothetical protein
MSVRRKRQLLLLSTTLALIGGCSRSPYPGFKHVADGIEIRLHELGEDDVAPADSDSIYLRVRMARHDRSPGSFFSTDQWYAARDTSAFRRLVVGRMMVGTA